MPAVSPKLIVSELIDAVHQSGGVASYISETARTHPKKLVVSFLGKHYSLWVYIWTLTRGGRISLPDEYRIQLTSVSSPLRKNPNGGTVLLGYYPELKMFAGFDLAKPRVG
jgi:putative restriction endonuclease